MAPRPLHLVDQARLGPAPARAALRGAALWPATGNPADALLPQERPKPGEDCKRFLNQNEIGLLLDAAVDPYRLPIATAIFMGLRIGELLGLTWEDIDFKAGVIKVRFQATRPGERARLKRRRHDAPWSLCPSS